MVTEKDGREIRDRKKERETDGKGGSGEKEKTEDIFSPPSMVFISVIIKNITNYNLSHVQPLWKAFMYCNYKCLSDL